MNGKEFEQALLELAMTTRAPLSRANISFYTGVPAKQAEKWLDELLAEAIVEIDTDDEGEIVYNVTGAKRPENGATALARCPACQRVTGAGSRCGHCGELLDNRLRALKAEVDRERALTTTSPSRRSPPASGDRRGGRGRSGGSAGRGGSSPLDLARVLSDIERFRRDIGKPAVADEKNVVVAGVLGLFGPLGWFYAGPHREAAIGLVVFLLAAKLLPTLLFAPLLTLLLPLSAFLSVLYAWQYNRSGERTSLFLESGGSANDSPNSDDDDDEPRPRRPGRRGR